MAARVTLREIRSVSHRDRLRIGLTEYIKRAPRPMCERRGRVTVALMKRLCVIASLLLAGCGEVIVPTDVVLSDPHNGVYSVDGPDTVESGTVRFEVSNSGATERGAELVAVAGEHGFDEVFEALIKARDGGPMPDWLRWAGGVGVLKPGADAAFTVDLTEGRYYAVDRSYEGKPAAADEAAFEVASTGPTITATEYGFRAQGLSAGRHTVRLVNAGVEPHNFVLAPIREGKTLADVERYVATDKGPPPVDFGREAISGVLEGGTRQDAPLDLVEGDYALLCFASDRAGGPPHVVKGMLAAVTVKD